MNYSVRRSRSQSLIKNPDVLLGTYRARAIIARGATVLARQLPHLPPSSLSGEEAGGKEGGEGFQACSVTLALNPVLPGSVVSWRHRRYPPPFLALCWRCYSRASATGQVVDTALRCSSLQPSPLLSA